LISVYQLYIISRCGIIITDLIQYLRFARGHQRYKLDVCEPDKNGWTPMQHAEANGEIAKTAASQNNNNDKHAYAGGPAIQSNQPASQPK
jgi:hypothetical protein